MKETKEYYIIVDTKEFDSCLVDNKGNKIYKHEIMERYFNIDGNYFEINFDLKNAKKFDTLESAENALKIYNTTASNWLIETKKWINRRNKINKFFKFYKRYSFGPYEKFVTFPEYNTKNEPKLIYDFKIRKVKETIEYSDIHKIHPESK